ncbi:TOBE domain-containing protein [Neorhizobium galegae]|uniref:TOBE domain-containing protein n=1 Tax=Neorhizobium galegae TaxID=399 RepID=UPI0009BA1818|nr:TOBE domain-containing protein [Neorhizobium galegae]
MRPEHIVLSDKGVAGTVHLVEPTGSSTEVMVTVGTQQISVLAHERLLVRPVSTSIFPTMFPRSASSTSANAREFWRM